MELHQLEYVMAVVKYNHFSHAADAVCISQSTLSHQINKLEEELGVRLFERSTRKVSLTPAGKAFATYAANALSQLHQGKRAMQEYITAECGELIIGAIPIIGMLGLVSVIASFQKNYPNLHIDIREDAGDQLWKDLQCSEIDVALIPPPQNYEQNKEFCFFPLITDEIVLIVNRTHPIATKRVIDLSKMKNENFIFMKANYGMHRVSLEACLKAGFEPSIVYQSSQVDTIAALVKEGLGVSLLTSSVAKHLKDSSIAIVKISNAPKRLTALAVPNRDHLSPAVSTFCKFVLDRF